MRFLLVILNVTDLLYNQKVKNIKLITMNFEENNDKIWKDELDSFAETCNQRR